MCSGWPVNQSGDLLRLVFLFFGLFETECRCEEGVTTKLTTPLSNLFVTVGIGVSVGKDGRSVE